jgi:hypothetical protein
VDAEAFAAHGDAEPAAAPPVEREVGAARVREGGVVEVEDRSAAGGEAQAPVGETEHTGHVGHFPDDPGRADAPDVTHDLGTVRGHALCRQRKRDRDP